MKRRFSIKFTVISLFILTTCITATVAISLQYYFSRQQALHTALDKYQNIAHSIGSEVREFDEVITNVTRLLSGLGQEFEQFDENHIARDAFVNLMADSPMFYSLYLARDDGHFYQLINLDSVPLLRQQLSATIDDRWVVVEVKQQNGVNKKTTSFYDADFHLRTSVSDISKFDATKRPWFIGAAKVDVYKTDPYLFHNVQLNGQTYASRIKNSKWGSVIGIDVVVSSLSHEVKQSLGQARTNLKAQFFIYDESGSLKSSSQDDAFLVLPKVTPLALTAAQRKLIADSGSIEVSNQTDWPPLDFAVFGKPTGYFVDIMKIVSLKTGMSFKFINGYSWLELVQSYKHGDLDILSPVANNKTNRSLGEMSVPLAHFNFGIASLDKGVHSLHQLQGKRVGILKGWSIINELKASQPQIQIVEIDDLYSGLKYLYSGELDAVMDLSVILKSTIDQHFLHGISVQEDNQDGKLHAMNSFHLVAKNLSPKLIDIINQAVSSLTPNERLFLDMKWFSDDSPRSVVPYKFLVDAAKDEELQGKLTKFNVGEDSYFGFVQQIDLFDQGREYLGITVPADSLLKAALSNVMAATLGSAAILLLLIPLSRIFSNPIINPILALIEQTKKVRQHRYLDVSRVPTRITELDELSISVKTTASELAAYQKQQQGFVDSFIQLIAQAIDDKSPYTAGHCNRVPDLAIMLAEKAEKEESSAFADFEFANDAQRREFRIAAWLHDCGKITTPEHIVDKGSKLEANYNRIHEIRTRFEVMIRDQIISFYQQQSPQLEPEKDAQLQQNIEQLKAEFAEVANANIGGEVMEDEAISRIEKIAQKTWTRYLDDQLGLSPEEERHLAHCKVSSCTPATETLLADKPQHLIPHPHDVAFDDSFEIKMEIPSHLANRGEVYNLCIARGTLTVEDRFKINEHIVSTIKMLERMPFPEELSKVPRYASTHHETMKGTGYPRKLHREQLSIPERILALADVFEALTAADRPYKKAKTLSQSLKIMKFMVLDEHLDRDVYRLFLRSEIYRIYAEKYLAPEQIDEINVEEYWV
ncbi:HD domain-containing phosphohydrolase [Vibrio rarus]|uniref:HD domain-containing phosphohydrolase n=1 Tax=Vibrio rarus TaxID=413403 RepID=UPI0021C2E3DD|nr:HD domain-containing phosphohydrolase [Vibrio rarus]